MRVRLRTDSVEFGCRIRMSQIVCPCQLIAFEKGMHMRFSIVRHSAIHQLNSSIGALCSHLESLNDLSRLLVSLFAIRWKDDLQTGIASRLMMSNLLYQSAETGRLHIKNALFEGSLQKQQLLAEDGNEEIRGKAGKESSNILVSLHDSSEREESNLGTTSITHEYYE